MSDYPDSAELTAIQTWTPGPKWSGGAPWLPILDLCDQAWNHDMGKVVRKGTEVTFITGGWSGNEEILSMLESNFSAYSMLWLESHRGGKHVFGVRE